MYSHRALRPVYSDTTQLDVELSCVGDADATQLNSTDLLRAVRVNSVSCIADRRRQLSCVGKGVYSDTTRRRVELSCVAMCLVGWFVGRSTASAPLTKSVTTRIFPKNGVR